MRLINDLRQHLTDKVTHFQTNPDRLIVTVEKGSLTWAKGSLSHRQSYSAIIEVDEYPEAMDANLILLPLIEWYDQNQDPFDPKQSPIRFESYVLNNGSTTVVFTVDIEESVVVKIGDDGGYLIDQCAMPTAISNLSPNRQPVYNASNDTWE